MLPRPLVLAAPAESWPVVLAIAAAAFAVFGALFYCAYLSRAQPTRWALLMLRLRIVWILIEAELLGPPDEFRKGAGAGASQGRAEGGLSLDRERVPRLR
jgi:uncharacterized membrane protein